MEKVRVYYDDIARTLCVWFGDPKTEDVCELVTDDTILMKDVDGHVIGFEKLHMELDPEGPGLQVEVVSPPGHAA